LASAWERTHIMNVVRVVAGVIGFLMLGAPFAAGAEDAVTPSCCQVAVNEEGPKACCQTDAGSDAFSGECCSLRTVNAEAQAGRRGQNHGAQGKSHGAQGKSHGKGDPQGGRESHGAVGVSARKVMQGARTLVFNHESITREVKEIPGGVQTVTTTTNPDLVPVLQKHPKEMVEHFEKGGSVRRWDPLFAELGKHYDKVDMKWNNLKDGIEITSTSDDPEVVKLIRAHAKKVSEFVSRGRAAMHEATPLPEDYETEQTGE